MLRHCRHVGGQKQYIFSPMGNKIVFSCEIVSLFQSSSMATVKVLYTSQRATMFRLGDPICRVYPSGNDLSVSFLHV